MDFVPLSDVFSRLVAYYAFHKIAERPEGITVDDIEAVASYCDKLASYKERLLLQKQAKARGGVSAPTNQNALLSPEGAVEPREPDCSAIVRHFLNILVIRRKSIDTSRRVILRYITTGRFPSYVLDETGLAMRLEPWIFKSNLHSAREPFRVRISPFDKQQMSVHVLAADLGYFVRHGRLKSEDPATTVEQGGTGPTPPDTAADGADHDAGKLGRPTLKPEITAAYKEIRDAGDINFDAPKIRLYGPIREKVRGYKGDQSLQRGLGKDAIRKVISPLFEADKNARPTSP